MSSFKVAYGTSDDRLNFAEVLLTLWVSENLNSTPIFFHYPKGEAWQEYEKKLFEPYSAPSPDSNLSLKEAGLETIKVFSLQQMIEEMKDLKNLSLGQVAHLIRKKREIQSFRAINFPPQTGMRPVYVSQKNNKDWVLNWSRKTLIEVLENSEIKIGGAFIYFIYGAWLAFHPEIIGILPKKLLADVMNAFFAGAEYIGNHPNVFYTGEFDFMTLEQWKKWEEDGKWRKVPSFVISNFIQSSYLTRIKELLIEKKIYVPLVYNDGHFYIR